MNRFASVPMLRSRRFGAALHGRCAIFECCDGYNFSRMSDPPFFRFAAA